MARILVIYYSRSGNTGRMARLVAEGAREAGAQVKVVPVAKAKAADLLKCDGVLLGSPTYYGAMAAELKKFIDDSVKLHGRLVGKVGGAFSSCGVPGGGSETTVTGILQALLIHGMVVPGDVHGSHYGPVAVGKPDKRAERQCCRMGRLVAALAARLHG